MIAANRHNEQLAQGLCVTGCGRKTVSRRHTLCRYCNDELDGKRNPYASIAKSITLYPEEWDIVDELRGDMSRSGFFRELVDQLRQDKRIQGRLVEEERRRRA